MKTIRVKEGRHYGTPFPFPKIYCGKEYFFDIRYYKFDESIRYNIGEEDQNDVNKLFGISYGWHQKQSDRIGFRYNIERDQVEIVLYTYEEGVRVPTKHISWVDIGETVNISYRINVLECGVREVYVNVIHIDREEKPYDQITYNFKHTKKCFGYTLGLYFGGNQTAPHEITIEEEIV